MNLPLLIKNVLRSISKMTHFLGCLIDDEWVKSENFNCWLFSQYFHATSFCFRFTDPEIRTHAVNMSNFPNNFVWVKKLKCAVVFVRTAHPRL